jgi:glycosyltransferase involved in cell wall biosynthesis
MISIITPIYNGLEFFPVTVASVHAQTRSDWEWLIVDDGSSDGTLEFCLDLAQRDSRISILRHPDGANLGQSASRNLAIRHASGDFLALLDCDDLWLPEKLERDVATFSRHPRAMFLYSRILNWYDWSGPAEINVWNKPGVLGIACDQVLEPPTVLLHLIRNLYDSDYQFAAPSCSTMRRSVLSAGEELFDPTFRRNFEDIVMLVKVLMRHPAVVSDDIRSCYRRHEHSFSAGPRRSDFDRDFGVITDWITSYAISTNSPSRPEIVNAIAVAQQRRTRFKRKMAMFAAARKVLPLQVRQWTWTKFGKRGLL